MAINSGVNIVVKTIGQGSIDRLGRSLDQASAKTKKLDAGIRGLKGAIGSIAAIAGVGLGIGAIFSEVTKADKATAALKSLGANTKELLPALREVRKELNNNVSAAELSAGAFEVLQSGFKETSDVTQILAAGTAAAKAKFADSKVVIQALSGVLNSYGISADQSREVTNKFFKTIKDGNLTIEQYSGAISGLANLGAATGVGLDQLNAGLARITQTGIPASEAATGLQATLRALIAPSSEAAKLSKELGIEFNAQALASKGLGGVLEDVVEKTNGSKESLVKLFGSIEAVTAILALSNDEFKGFNKALESQRDSTDAVGKAFDASANTIAGALTRVQNAITGLITSGQGLGRAVIPVLDGIAVAIDALQGPIGIVVAALGGLAIAWYAAAKAAGVYAAAQAAATGSGAISAIGALVTKVAALGGGATVLASKFTAAGAGIATVTTKVTAGTVAMGLLKGAMLALPWVALAAGIAAATVVVVKHYQEQAKLNRLMNASKTMLDDLAGAESQLKDAIKAKNSELDRSIERLIKLEEKGSSNARALQAQKKRVAELRAELEALKGEYPVVVKLRIEEEYIKAYDASQGADLDMNAIRNLPGGANNPLKPKVELPKLGGGGGGGGGGGAAPQNDTDTATELLRTQEQQFDLLKATTDLERQLLSIEHEREDAMKNINSFQGIADGLREELIANEALLASTKQQDAILDNVMSKTAAQVQAARDTLLPLEQQRALLEAKLNGTEEEYRLQQEIEKIVSVIGEEFRGEATAIVQGNAALEDRVEKMEEMKKLSDSIYKRLGAGITDALTEGITAAVQGAEDLEETLKNIAQNLLADIGQMLLKAGLNAAFTGTPFAGAFASGGTVPSNSLALVGEKGPELIKTGGSSSRVYSNEESRQMMSNADTMDRYSYKGGTPPPTPVNFRLETTTIMGQEYLTREQGNQLMRMAAAEGAKQGAKSGETRVMASLRNSRSRRKALGL